MAADGECTKEETLDCPNCFRQFESPRVMPPCLHTICEKCLADYGESQLQGKKEVFTCPICHTTVAPLDKNLEIETWVGSFPLNSMICFLVKTQTKSTFSNNNCESCKQDGETTTAEFWCIECQEKLCPPCNKYHRRMKKLRNHKTVPINEKVETKQSNVVFDQDCVHHRGHKVEMFCVKHRQMCCVFCVTEGHRECTDLRSLRDAAEAHAKRFGHEDVIKELTYIISETGRILKEKKDNMAKVEAEKQKLCDEMDLRIDRFIEKLNSLRKVFKDGTEISQKVTNFVIQKNETVIKRFMTSVSNYRQILESVESICSSCDKFVAFENLRSQITSHFQQLKSDLKDDTEAHLGFKENKVVCGFEESLKSLGSSEMVTVPSKPLEDALKNTDSALKNIYSKTIQGTEMLAAQIAKEADLMTSSVTFVKAVTRKDLGKETWLVGGAFVADGRIAMADYRNKRILLLDDEFNFVQECKIDGSPTSIASGNDDSEIYIVVNDKKSIYKYTLQTNLSIENKIVVPYSILAVAVIGENLLLGTNDVATILTIDGRAVESVKNIGDYSHVSASQSQRTIYHSDDDDIICQTLEGKEIFRYRDQQLKSPRGICLDKFQNIYVCGTIFQNVVQISSDGQRSRILLGSFDSITKPCNVMFHPRRNELIVMSEDEETVFEVYRFN